MKLFTEFLFRTIAILAVISVIDLMVEVGVRDRPFDEWTTNFLSLRVKVNLLVAVVFSVYTMKKERDKN